MSDELSPFIKDLLEKSLEKRGVDIIDFLSFSATQDPLIHQRVLSETQFIPGVDYYWVGVRKHSAVASLDTPGSLATPEEQIYVGKGKLNADYLEKNARLLIKAGDIALAKNIYQSLIQSGEKIASALLGLAICNEREGRVPEAISQLEESIAYQPSLIAYQKLVKLYIAQNQERNAVSTIERALFLRDLDDGSRAEFHQVGGNCYLRKEEYSKAEGHYLKALSFRPNLDEVRSNLGTAYLKQERFADAKRSFQDALAANINNEKAWVGLGTCYEYEKDPAKSHDCYVKALQLDAHDVLALFKLTRVSIEIKKFSFAEKHLKEYADSSPVSVSLLYTLAVIQLQQSKLADARETLFKIISIQPASQANK
ncbi:MAG: tetratricopeptide repeat protein [Xanthomonadaceae bacterium]|nr:tetratricopeptide repeat protein [Xanthomonadaceae bacterium]